MKEYLEAMRQNWFIPQLYPPDICGCADMKQYPPKRILDQKNFGRIHVFCFRHTREDGETKDCCCATDNRGGWLTFERYLELLE